MRHAPDAHAVPPVPARLHLSNLVRGLSLLAVLGGAAALAWAFGRATPSSPGART